MNNLTEYQYTQMPFGKHKDLYLDELPQDYLEWLCRSVIDRAQHHMFETERARRGKIFAKKPLKREFLTVIDKYII